MTQTSEILGREEAISIKAVLKLRVGGLWI